MKYFFSFRFSFFLFITGIFLWTACGTNRKMVVKKTSPTNTNNSNNKSISKKYAGILEVKEQDVSNTALYSFIDDWYGVPYKYGGKSKNGVDCSGFVSNLYQDVYKEKVSGSSASIYESCKPVSIEKLKEGDMVFFKIDSDKISHIGVYLMNNKFVHASTKKGVMISSLNEAYYKKYYYKGGKLK